MICFVPQLAWQLEELEFRSVCVGDYRISSGIASRTGYSCIHAPIFFDRAGIPSRAAIDPSEEPLIGKVRQSPFQSPALHVSHIIVDGCCV